MPIYEYHCTACGQFSEFLQKHSDAPKKTCPHCGKESLEKQVSAAGFQLKGTGWYETDFKSKKKEKDSTPKTKKPTETKSD